MTPHQWCVTDQPFSDRIPTRPLIQDLLTRTEEQERLAAVTAELSDAHRRLRVVRAATEELDRTSLVAQRRLREADPVYAAGYEQGMVDAREHVLAALRRSSRPEVLAQVRALLASVDLTDGDPD